MIRLHDITDVLFTGNGRIGRLAFVLGLGAVTAIAFLAALIPPAGWAGEVLFWAIRLPLLFVLFCLMAQRLHDIGRSGWWAAPAIAVVWLAPSPMGDFAYEVSVALHLIWFGGLAVWPGQKVFNRYGAPPSGLASTTGPKTA